MRSEMRTTFATTACFLAALGLAGCGQGTADKPATPAAGNSPAAAPADAPATTASGSKHVTPSGLTIIDVQPGHGDRQAKPGDTVLVHYTGRLQSNGQKFDSSLDRNEPIDFVLGRRQVIAGWEEGIAGMKVGEKRQLIIPPSLGYGAQDNPPIPGNSTLVFDVELVGIK